MKKLFWLGLLATLFLALAGCSSGDGGGVFISRPVYDVDIYSDQPSDGYIAFDPVQQLFTVSNGPANLFFGIDSLDPSLPEYRAFLDFPLDGSTGEPVVPASAFINSAILEVFVNEVSFASTVPTLIDLVSYSLAGLRVEDFSSLPLATQNVNFFPSDQGAYVAIDVTQLMREAQRLGLADLQLRLVLDFAVNNGFVGLDDRPTVSLTAPLLKVSYEF
jgi:hypothetical protein